MSAPIPSRRLREQPPATPPVISHYQAAPLLEARSRGETQVRTSLDLNLTQTVADLTPEGVQAIDGPLLPWPLVEDAAENETACFLVTQAGLEKAQAFSEETGRVYTLYPTPGAPTMLVSGIPMHRIKGTNPYADTIAKIRAVAPVAGDVLDTATGLGYTAVHAARSASHVLTIELDPAALEVARLNPWSRELFDNPKIEQRIGDTFEVIRTLDSDAFDVVIHDPPQFALAGELYSAVFYRQLQRVLRPGGRLYHYVGDPESRSGASTTRSVIRRLEEAGFRKVTRRPEAFGLTAAK